MALVVFDRGTRIKTPVSSLFSPRKVEAASSSGPEPALPDSDQSARDELEHLTEEYRRFAEQSTPQAEAAKAYQQQDPSPSSANRAPSLKAKQIMSQPVVSVTRQAGATEAIRLMDSHGINHLIVVDDQERAIGLVTRIDILRHPSNEPAQIEELFKSQFVVAGPDTQVNEIAANLVTYHIGCVPVIDAEDNLLGIITRTDLLRLMISQAQIEGWV